MSRQAGWIGALLLAVMAFFGTIPAEAADGHAAALRAALIIQAAGRLDEALGAVAASTRSLAGVYSALSRTPAPVTAKERAYWLQHRLRKGDTVGFCRQSPEPAGLAPQTAYYSYAGEHVTDETLRQLDIMQRLSPALMAAHDAFPYSWVYVTSVSQSFAIYPYLPLDKAVQNAKPTQQNFYTIADFKHKDCGWESPYLDLVGAGMMVTVSCPAYADSTLLGVVSHDITLTQLSSTILAELASIPNSRAVIVNRRGKAIAASDPKMAAFLSDENAKAKDAVTYFRPDRGLVSLGLEKGVSSPDETVNAAVETVIERANTNNVWPIIFSQNGFLTLAARTKTTGWYVVLLVPETAAK